MLFSDQQEERLQAKPHTGILRSTGKVFCPQIHISEMSVQIMKQIYTKQDH